MRILAVVLLVACSPPLYAQTRTAASTSPSGKTPSSDPVTREASGHRWLLDVSLSNLFDGNILHDPTPRPSYGVIPAAELRYESSVDPAIVLGYELASNTYSGTDRWDRFSQNAFATGVVRVGARVRLETRAQATWKGSSEDRELSNEFGLAERLALRVRDRTRVVFTGAYRYKQYPDDPGTSGASPYLSIKIDRRMGGERRLAFGYKHQARLSRAERDRYMRSAYTLDISTPVTTADDRLSFEFEYRPQRYQRMIDVGGQPAQRRDRRLVLAGDYRRPISPRTDVTWRAGLENRDSNDPDKRYVAPTFGVVVTYHWR